MFNQSKAHSGPDEQPATSAGEIAEPCTLLFGEDDDLGDHGESYEDDAGEGPFEPRVSPLPLPPISADNIHYVK